MSEEKKPLSERLRAARDEFNDLSAKAKAAAGKLDSLIMEAFSQENRAELDKVLHQFIPTVDKSSLKGHDIIFLVNKSQEMGEGFFSPIGAAISTATSLAAATGGHDVKVSGVIWEAGNYTKALPLADADRAEKAREKSKTTNKELLPAVKEIMLGNTPDKQDERLKHYIVISPGSVTDNVDHSVQMINTALKMNPRVTFDFITVGSGEGNIKDLVAKIEAPTDAQKPSLLIVPTHEGLNGAVMTILTGRFKGEAPKIVDAPKVEAPKAEVIAAPEAPKPVEAPVVQAAKTEAAPVAQAPKTEAPVVATAAAAQETPAAQKKKWYRFGR
jgi:hypothetical protein